MARITLSILGCKQGEIPAFSFSPCADVGPPNFDTPGSVDKKISKTAVKKINEKILKKVLTNDNSCAIIQSEIKGTPQTKGDNNYEIQSLLQRWQILPHLLPH